MQTTKSELICLACGTINPIQRSKRRLQKVYHIKDLYCYECKTITKQVELRNSDMFKKELEFKEELNNDEMLIKDLLNKQKTKKLRI